MRADADGEFWHIVAGAAIGAVVGGLSSIISQAIAGEDINWTAVAISAASGALSGAINAAVPCMGALATGVIEGSISAGTYAATEKLAYGRDPTWEDTLKVGLQSGIMAGGMKEIAQSIGLCNCFIAGTLVATETGYVTIENIRAGDLVWATDPETGETALKPVVQTFKNESNELVHIKVCGEEIVATPGHPFWSPVKGWTKAINLRAGDRLQLLNGEYVVVEQVQHKLLESPVAIYNFEVADFHTYYVGEEPVLVHNTGCGNKLDSKTVAGPEKVGRYKGVRIDVEVGGSGKTNIHMTAQGYDKMYYSNGTFPTAPTKLAESQFVKKGLAKAFDYINRKGLRFP